MCINLGFYLDFENDKGTISINVKRNETLIEQRRALAEKNEVKFDNVYVFFIDALSRNHFLKRKIEREFLIGVYPEFEFNWEEKRYCINADLDKFYIHFIKPIKLS